MLLIRTRRNRSTNVTNEIYATKSEKDMLKRKGGKKLKE